MRLLQGWWWLVVFVVLAMACEGCGGSVSKAYTRVATKDCLVQQSAVSSAKPPDASEIDIGPTAIGGSLDVSLDGGNTVTLSFFHTGGDAKNALNVGKLFASGFKVKVTEREDHVDRNVLVAWDSDPTDAEIKAVEGCLT